MSDLISKTEALIKIRGCYPSLPIFEKNRKAWQEKYEGYIKAYEIIQDLPTVEPKTGHWICPTTRDDIFNKDFFSECSECGELLMDETDYCPFCGAKMERSKDD